MRSGSSSSRTRPRHQRRPAQALGRRAPARCRHRHPARPCRRRRQAAAVGRPVRRSRRLVPAGRRLRRRATTGWRGRRRVRHPAAREPYGQVAVFLDMAGNRWDLLGPGLGPDLLGDVSNRAAGALCWRPNRLGLPHELDRRLFLRHRLRRSRRPLPNLQHTRAGGHARRSATGSTPLPDAVEAPVRSRVRNPLRRRARTARRSRRRPGTAARAPAGVRIEGLRAADDLADAPPAEVEVVLFLVVEPLGLVDRGAGDVEAHLDDHLMLEMPELAMAKGRRPPPDGSPTWAADTLMPVSSRSSRTAASRYVSPSSMPPPGSSHHTPSSGAVSSCVWNSRIRSSLSRTTRRTASRSRIGRSRGSCIMGTEHEAHAPRR